MDAEQARKVRICAEALGIEVAEDTVAGEVMLVMRGTLGVYNPLVSDVKVEEVD
jgi:hypothetical protein